LVEKWIRELSPEQIAHCTRIDIKFGVALCLYAGDSRMGAVMSGMSPGLRDVVRQAMAMWRFEQLDGCAAAFETIVKDVAGSHHPSEAIFEVMSEVGETANNSREIVVEAVVEQSGESTVEATDATDGTYDGAYLVTYDDTVDPTLESEHEWLPYAIVFRLPPEVMSSAFRDLSNDEKLGLIVNLDEQTRQGFLAIVAPVDTKLGQFLSFELSRVEGDSRLLFQIRQARMTYLRRYVSVCHALISANTDLQEKVIQLLEQWNTGQWETAERGSDHGRVA
jgi:hypothetical protein